MVEYCLKNVNPKNRKTGDCVTRALTTAIDIPYEQARQEQFDLCVKTGYEMCDKKVYEKVLENHGFIKFKQPKRFNGKKYLAGEIDELVDIKRFNVFITVSNHCTSIRDGKLVDIWDCRNKTICNYYVKGE